MAGVDDGLGWKRQDFFADAGEQQVAIATWKIPAADPIGEQDVPTEELVLFGKIEAEASRAVTRDQ